MKNPSVEIMILHFNNINFIDNCLKSLLKLTYKNFKITVIDNGSTDDSVNFIRKKYPIVNLIENKKNYGFAGGYNRAIPLSKSDFILFLNNDVIVDKNFLTEMIKVAVSDNRIAVLQPKVLSLRDKKMFDHAGAAGGFIDLFGYPICRGRVFDTIEKDNGQYNDLIDVFWVCGVSMLIRRNVLKETGLFDEDFFLYAEEIDLSWRVNLLGYRLVYAPKSVIYHVGKGSSSKEPFKMLYLFHRNHLLILLKNYSTKNLIWITPIKMMLELITFFVSLSKLNFKKSLSKLNFMRAPAILLVFLWIITHPFLILNKHKEVQRMRKVDDEAIMRKMLKTSVALQYHLFRERTFDDYKNYLK